MSQNDMWHKEYSPLKVTGIDQSQHNLLLFNNYFIACIFCTVNNPSTQLFFIVSLMSNDNFILQSASRNNKNRVEWPQELPNKTTTTCGFNSLFIATHCNCYTHFESNRGAIYTAQNNNLIAPMTLLNLLFLKYLNYRVTLLPIVGTQRWLLFLSASWWVHVQKY